MDTHKAIKSQIAKPPRKFLISKVSSKEGNSLVGMLSKNLDNVPDRIPKSVMQSEDTNFFQLF
ncbi:hypothetical protein MFLO_06564 [Listeria floridensis FSL S10-1187]|uniref:Uncharacterized protein n=1 Tax=Listeria floridensis FSL S10-1187 TaxID=1265817 RepID=A0ABP3B0Q1_9LIST|nr:hypothetical protein MFLO_06564 [Listeria floridensis FSL S10-1187]